MKVAFGSMFQDSTKYLDRFIAQYFSLVHAAPEHQFTPILAEGDSHDEEKTWKRLNEIFPGSIIEREHGGTRFGQVDNLQRWLQIAFVVDGVFEHVPADCDAMLYIESDLLWDASTILKMLARIPEYDAVVPMIMLGDKFYDTWGYVSGNRNFVNNAPFHPVMEGPHNGLIKLDSGGGCVAMRAEVARTCRCRPPTQAIKGFYRDMASRGWSVWLDHQLKVFHPIYGR